ncbi:MAG: hypothetical protein Q7S61_02825 [bacterium]|nr:hypothetical protein [bacterium]
MFRYSSKTFGEKNQKVIFFLTGWRGSILQHSLIAYLLQLNGYRVIVYSYDKSILSPNTKETATNCNLVKEDVKKRVKELKREGIDTFYLFGNSLGSLLPLMIANEIPKDISKIILNLVSADLAETVWGWNKVKRLAWFKESLVAQKIVLSELKDAWESLSPINNTDNLKGVPILLYNSTRDELISAEQTQKIARKLRGITSVKTITNHNSHKISLISNLLRFPVYLRFLRS